MRRGRPKFVIARVLAAALLVGAAAGCAAVLGFEDTTLRTDTTADGGMMETGPIGEGGTTTDGGTHFSAKPTALVLRRGGTVDLEVDLARGTDVTGSVTAHLAGLPSGVTATTATLAPTSSTGTITLSAAAKAALGSSALTLSADGTALAPLAISLLVADPAGSLDVTFDMDGLVSDSTKGLGSTFFALGVQSDQKIVAGGAGGPGGATPPSGWLLRRFAANGAADAPFDTLAGAVGIPTDGAIRALAIMANGSIVCAGESTAMAAPKPQLTLMRFTAAGKIDPTFGGGIVRLPAAEAAGGSIGLGVVVDPTGAVVVVGSRKDILNTESGIITRFKADGTRDATFNGGTTVDIANVRFVGVSLESSAIVAGGSTITGALPSYFITRRTAIGANDPTFGTAGSAAFGNTYRANAFARLGDGTLAVVGDVQSGSAGYTAGFITMQGNSPFARTYANAASAGFFGIGVQADGRIIAAGHTAVVNGEARVQRILPDGNKDLSFNDGGTVLIEPPGGIPNFDVTLFAAAVQVDGRILTAGNRTTTGAVIYRLWP